MNQAPSPTQQQCLRQAHQATIGIVLWTQGMSQHHDVKIICESCAITHPYLVSFPFYTIPIFLLFKIRRIRRIQGMSQHHDVKIICESCAISHPYLVSFPFYTIPIFLLFKIRRIF